MFRITRIVPATVLAAGALALAVPVAQAKPLLAPSVSPIVESVHAANADTQAHTVVVTTADKPLPNPVQQHVHTVVVTTGDKPLPNPVKLPSAPVSTPDSSGSSFDWTAAAIGAGLGGIVMLMLAGGFGVRRRGQLAA